MRISMLAAAATAALLGLGASAQAADRYADYGRKQGVKLTEHRVMGGLA